MEVKEFIIVNVYKGDDLVSIFPTEVSKWSSAKRLKKGLWRAAPESYHDYLNKHQGLKYVPEEGVYPYYGGDPYINVLVRNKAFKEVPWDFNPYLPRDLKWKVGSNFVKVSGVDYPKLEVSSICATCDSEVVTRLVHARDAAKSVCCEGCKSKKFGLFPSGTGPSEISKERMDYYRTLPSPLKSSINNNYHTTPHKHLGGK